MAQSISPVDQLVCATRGASRFGGGGGINIATRLKEMEWFTDGVQEALLLVHFIQCWCTCLLHTTDLWGEGKSRKLLCSNKMEILYSGGFNSGVPQCQKCFVLSYTNDHYCRSSFTIQVCACLLRNKPLCVPRGLLLYLGSAFICWQ